MVYYKKKSMLHILPNIFILVNADVRHSGCSDCEHCPPRILTGGNSSSLTHLSYSYSVGHEVTGASV